MVAERQAVANFLRLLPQAMDRWVVAYEPVHHAGLARAVLHELDVAAAIELGFASPDRVREIAQEKRGDPRCGFLEFVVVDGDRTHLGIDYRDALMHFGRWDTERVKLCFDVTDANFDALFAEDPFAVRERCRQLRAVLAQAPALAFRSGESALALRCDPAGWRAHSGLEPDDYVLPSGEVECLPAAVDGVLDVDGWLIGTIPFGMKYGRIARGDLRLRLERGLIVGVGGGRRDLCAEVDATLTALPGLRHVVELGLGQSKAVARAASLHEVACLWHERHFGLHLGLGAALVDTPGEVKKSHHHLDIVMASGELTAEGRTILSW